MENVLKRTMVFFGFIVLAACSKDEEKFPEEVPSNTFSLDATSYSVNLASLGVKDRNNGTSDASLTVSGGNGSKVGSVSFLVRFTTNEGIDGTYTAGGGSPSPGTYSSILSVYATQDGSEIKNGNNPVGEIEITDHGQGKYTARFAVKYSTGVDASGKVTRTFTDVSD